MPSIFQKFFQNSLKISQKIAVEKWIIDAKDYISEKASQNENLWDTREQI